MRPPEFQNKSIILGVQITDQPMDFVLQKIDQFLNSNDQHKIYTPNPEICLKAEKDDEYRHVLNRADINIPDGIGLKLGAKILGETLENRVAGSDLTKEILEKYKDTETKVFIVLRNDSLSTEADIKKLFKEKYPKLNFQISQIDIKNPDNCDEVLNSINTFGPKILFVTLGAPAQEFWINKYIKLIPGVKVAIGIGGSIDFLTEKIKRAPKLVRDSGLEWAYRLYQEPSRLKRIKNATADFLLVCHKWKKRIQSEYRQNVIGVTKNKEGKFLIIRNPRFGKNHWQFPQGGVDQEETPETAVVRESSEEVGASEKLFKLIKKIPEQHRYDNPAEYQNLLKGFKGQEQTAFLLEFQGKDSNIDFSDSEEVEEIKWVSKDEILQFIHPHRQEFAKKIIAHL
ncbi:WecB/TagA/CpsF family glycosyltransferase [Candidatus Kuenenbacteria bacterium]|nr:WecB/TagA/CpsF family glycosyltransferase [Candidatus Kuenenbacteria bacterium]